MNQQLPYFLAMEFYIGVWDTSSKVELLKSSTLSLLQRFSMIRNVKQKGTVVQRLAKITQISPCDAHPFTSCPSIRLGRLLSKVSINISSKDSASFELVIQNIPVMAMSLETMRAKLTRQSWAHMQPSSQEKPSVILLQSLRHVYLALCFEDQSGFEPQVMSLYVTQVCKTRCLSSCPLCSTARWSTNESYSMMDPCGMLVTWP